MKILIKQDFDTMSEWAKMLLLSTMSQDKRVNLSITAGKTPALVYQKLASIVKNSSDFDNVHYYNFDEIPHTATMKVQRLQLEKWLKEQ